MTNDLSALDRNVRLRNGRRELPREIPRRFRDDAMETLGHLTIYTVIAAVIFIALFTAFSIADSQMAIEDRINQESQRLPACVTEDSDNCQWDAQRQGNHKGRSFTVQNGEVTYAQ